MLDIPSIYKPEKKLLLIIKDANILVGIIIWNFFFSKGYFPCEELTFNVGY